MSFQLKFTEFFLSQAAELSLSARKLIDSKLDLLKENPFRFKPLHSKRFKKLFRIRLNLDGVERRLVYAVIEPNVVVACIIDRKNDYKSLEKYLKKTGL
jgi:mRNA-degrading endonuclease RelE of RelBE toxin-antitoxin system